VPVFIMSGWQDGYKNPVERVVRGLGELGRPVTGMLGPWGHRYPFDAAPGPRVDWLRYVTSHWWDRWLKGAEPDPSRQWPELTVWMGDSREPGHATDFIDQGRWVAEDHGWLSRMQPEIMYLVGNGTLSRDPAASRIAELSKLQALTVAGTPLATGTTVLETSSFGHAGNDDLPGDQNQDDHQSILFDSAPLPADLECFGYPEVRLNIECDKPIASLAVRVTEVSPATGESHLVSYSFFNLVYRNGDQANPEPVEAGVFPVTVPLNIIGHVFKRGWKIRVAISPFYFPTMWQAPAVPMIKLYAGPINGLPESAVILPGRPRRPEDAGMAALLPPRTTYVDPELYVPTVETGRAGSHQRTVERIVVDGMPGTLVRKDFDSGRTVLGGILDNLEVDVRAQENFRILDGHPLSDTGYTRYETSLGRADWQVKLVTETRVWSDATADGPVFRYSAEIHAFIGAEPFADTQVQGTIPRRWV
jgi:hypothetical protein